MADGNITFSTKLDNSGIQKDLNAAKREIEKANKSIADANAAKIPLVKQIEGLGPALDEAKAKLAELQRQQSVAAQALDGGELSESYLDAYVQKPELDSAVAEQNKQVERLQKEWDSVNNQIDKYDQKINEANNAIAKQQEIAGNLSAKLATSSSGAVDSSARVAGSTSKMAQASMRAAKSATSFQKRMNSIVKQVFLFGLITKGLSGVADYMGRVLKSNNEFSAQLAKLKGALLTALQPIYEYMMPLLLSLLKIATAVVESIIRLFSFITGKSAAEYAKNAKALYEKADALEEVGNAAKKTARSLAEFDEINRISSDATEKETITAPDFSAFDLGEIPKQLKELTLDIKAKIDELAFSWDEGKLWQNQDAWIVALSGLLGAVIGGMFGGVTGSIVGLLLGLAVGLISCTFLDKLKNPEGAKSVVIVVLSAILGAIIGSMFGGLAGGVIGLIVGLAIGLAGVAFNDSLSEGTRTAAQKALTIVITTIVGALIGAVFGGGVFGGIIGGVVGLIFGLAISFADVEVANGFTVGDLIDSAGAGVSAGVWGTSVASYSADISDIPALATGAVIPPNHKFLAVLGDQKHGTNVEAPLATIQEAVAIVMEDMIQSNIAGHEATVAVLREILSAVLGIHIGDDVIGQAVARYNARMATIRGGAV